VSAGPSQRQGSAQRPARTVSPARQCAYRVLRRVAENDAYADRAFRAEATRAALDTRERAFAQQLSYGTVQRIGTLDHLIGRLSSRPVEDLDPPLRDALRLGVFQLGWLDGVADHAAVSETVELAKEGGRGGHRLANALMRRATRELQPMIEALGDGSPAEAALLHSHPEWLVQMWWDLLGQEGTLALLARNNEPPERAVRANALLTTRDELAEGLRKVGVQSHPVEQPREALVVDSPFDPAGSPLFQSGRLMPQSRASMLVARVLGPRPGDRVLDLCAAPGAKTTHLAALMEGEGEIVALERHPGRAAELEANCRRMRAERVTVMCADATRAPVEGGFDRVLLDAPCSALGTLQGRPDARWRRSPQTIKELTRVQDGLLAAAADQLTPGGTLVYSTCTISPSEGEERIEALLTARSDLEADDLGVEWPALTWPRAPQFLQLLPHRDQTDGFFIARLKRSP